MQPEISKEVPGQNGWSHLTFISLTETMLQKEHSSYQRMAPKANVKIDFFKKNVVLWLYK